MTPPTRTRAMASGRILVLTLVLVLAEAMIVSTLAQMRNAPPGVAEADVRVVPDTPIGLVLCVIDTSGRARCHGKDGVTSAAEGRWAGVCGLADQRLESPCAGGECVFPGAAPRGEALGLILLEARPPLFGMPRHRLVDLSVLSPSPPPTPVTREMERAVLRIARCFAPGDRTVEARPVPVLHRRECADGPCRLQHSSVQVAMSAGQP